MELVEKTDDIVLLNENRVICDGCSLELKNSFIKFEGKGNVVCFFGDKTDVAKLEKCKITLKGSNNVVFVGASRWPLKLLITLGHGCVIYVGRDLYTTTSLQLFANERSRIHIGELALVARNVCFRTSDMHMIYDAETLKRINPNKDIFVGKHVWIGQDVTILKGVEIGHGSVIGLGSLCTGGGRTAKVNACYIGRPAVEKRKGITWRHKGTNQVTEEELLSGKYDELHDRSYIYTEEDMRASLKFFSEGLDRCDSAQAKLDFLREYGRSERAL